MRTPCPLISLAPQARALLPCLVGAVLLLAQPASAQEAPELETEYWAHMLEGTRAAQTCLADVMVEGSSEVQCNRMTPAFVQAVELAEQVEACCPERMDFEIEGVRQFNLLNFARGHRALADSIEAYRGRNEEGARARRVELAGQVMAWRTVIELGAGGTASNPR